MKLIILVSILLVALAACAAPERDKTQEDIDQAIAEAHRPDRTQEEVIDLSPTAADSSIHADVGDRIIVQVDVPGHSGCKDLTVRDPFGNAAVELAPNEMWGGGVQFRGAFFATANGEYTVELDPESGNLSCGSPSSPVSVKVKWTVQPH